MRHEEIADFLRHAYCPADGAEDSEDGQGIEGFLRGTVQGEVPVFIQAGRLSLYSISLPEESLKGSYVADLLLWDRGQNGGYLMEGEEGSTVAVNVAPPLEIAGEILSYGEPVTYCRTYQLKDKEISYMEIGQGLAALCGFDQEGLSGLQEPDAVKVLVEDDLKLVTAGRVALGRHLRMRESVLLRLVDYRRRDKKRIALGGSRDDQITNDHAGELYLRITRRPNDVWIRGFQVLRGSKSKS